MRACAALARDAGTAQEGLLKKLTVADLADAIAKYLPPEEIGRHELSNRAWALVAPLLPQRSNRRGLPRDQRQLLNGMLWALRTGAPWRDVPKRYGPWKTVWRNFTEWRQAGVLEEVKAALLGQLDSAGKLDWDLWCIDGTSIRATRAAAGARKRGARRTSRRTTRSVARGEDSAPRSTS